MSIALCDLLGNTTVPEFELKYWTKKPYFVSGTLKDRVAELFSFSILEDLISSDIVSKGHFSIAGKGSRVTSPSSALREDGSISLAAVLQHYLEGSTLVVNRLRTKWRPIAELCIALESEIGHPIDVNCYATPKLSQGFPIHADPHEVFIIQIAGSKHWKIYDRLVSNPTLELMNDVYKGSTPIDEVKLEAGDVLYLPSGYPHEALTTMKEASLHLTVGIHRYRFSDLLKRLIDETSKVDERLRQPLPFGILRNPICMSQLIEDTEKILDGLKFADISASLKAISCDFRDRTREIHETDEKFSIFETVNLKNRFTLKSRFFSPHSRQLFISSESPSHFAVRFPGGTLQFENEYRIAVDHIIKSDSFVAHELVNDDADVDALFLVEKFADAGLLYLATENKPLQGY